MNNVQYIKALNTFISLDEVFSELSKQLFSYLPRIIFLGNQKVFDWIKNMLLFFSPHFFLSAIMYCQEVASSSYRCC